MKLPVDVTVYKRFESQQYSRIETIKISFLNLHIIYSPKKPLVNFAKFKRTPERIIRLLNREPNKIILETPSDIWLWSDWNEDKIIHHHFLQIDSYDLLKVKLRKEQRKIINREIDEVIKRRFIHNPPKKASEMEYRKRAYYGKCKKH